MRNAESALPHLRAWVMLLVKSSQDLLPEWHSSKTHRTERLIATLLVRARTCAHSYLRVKVKWPARKTINGKALSKAFYLPLRDLGAI